jgi:radical SAM superfamily enzyme YgiQ (UPF0313 family)
MKILFINAINPFAEVQYRFPQLGLGYLAASLRKHFEDIQIRIVDRDVEKELDAFKPEIVGITSVSQNYGYAKQYARAAKKRGITVIIGGIHISALPQTITEDMDYAVMGEGERTIVELVEAYSSYKPITGIKGIVYRSTTGLNQTEPRPFIEPLDSIPFPARDLLKTGRFGNIFSSRGCPYTCLAGETIIHTITGDVPIQDLVGKTGVKVLTRDPVTQEPLYVEAVNIRKVKEMSELVRVRFDDGSHIDCTPDHKFKVFKAKNQFIDESERDVEAKDLQPKQSVRAVRFEVQKTGRVAVSTRRDIVLYRAQIVMESFLGRKLSPSERVHHKDRNPGNDSHDNFILTDTSKHPTLHPELSERMKNDNPVKNMTPEWREKLRLSVTGKVRSLEQRIRYRESKLGEKNPHFNPNAIHMHKPSRIQNLCVNHKIVAVEKLERRADVYCMEIPGIHWFYANKVLVHNCTFCASTRYWNKLRFFSAEYVVAEIKEMVEKYGARRISFYDDLMIADKARLEKMADLIQREPVLDKIKFGINARANLITDYTAEILKAMHVNSVGMGLESGNERTLRYLKGGSVSVEDNYNAVKVLHRYGIAANASFIIGSPDETREEILDTLKFIKTSGLNFVDTFFLTPLPGTPIWEEAKSRGLVSDDMDFSRLNIFHAKDPIIMSERIGRDELLKLHRRFEIARLGIAAKGAWVHPFFGAMVKAGMANVANVFRRATCSQQCQ